MSLVQYLDHNKHGRDIVVGDLHGKYSLLMDMLEDPVVNFKKDNDRLISVGDLVDRGEQSVECLKLINEPWFYSILGNHELALIKAAEEFDRTNHWHGKVCSDLIKYGGKWIKDYFDQDNCMIYNPVRDLVKKTQQLPLVIVINKDEDRDRVNIVHAELRIQDYGICTDADIDDEFHSVITYFQESGYSLSDAEEIIIRSFTEGRAIALSDKRDENQKGLSLTFSGHTPVSEISGYNHARPYRFSHVFMDTGACYQSDNDGLTIVNLVSGERYFMASGDNANKDIKVDRLEIF